MPEIENANLGSLAEDIDCVARARVVLTLREWQRVTPSLKVFGFLRLMELSLIDR